MLNENKIIQLSNFYKSMGDPTRLRILITLLENKKSVSELVNELNMSQSAISHQLQVLREHRIVKNERLGKSIIYSIDDNHVSKTIIQGIEHISHGEDNEDN